LTDQSSRRTLTPGDKNNLIARMRGLVRTASDSRTAEPHVDRPAPAFNTLEEYKSLTKHRNVARDYQVADPFFREQDGRAGATTWIDGQEAVNFSSYDYLGLNHVPSVAAAAKAAIDQYGTSVSASRLVAGERRILRDLERKLADVYQAEDAVVFVSGHATNVGVISTLMRPQDLVLYDSLCHSSILVGTKLSGAVRRAFPHNDLAALERMLEDAAADHERVLIVVEGLYSMDGDLPDLKRLIEIKRRHGAWLMVDEAHSLGVLGTTGRGLAEHAGVDPREVDIWMGTLSKTLAGAGGYIAGSASLIELLKLGVSGYIYSVGLSPPVAGAAIESLAVMAREPERGARLKRNGKLFLETARAAGLDTGLGEGYAVCPVLIGDSLRAAKLTEILLKEGLNVLPIIYPAVPMQAARLRFFITSEHTEEQIRSAIATTKRELDKLVAQGFGLSMVARLLASGQKPWSEA
jgi:8-amino-7-oxononanoate synthase